MPWIWIGRFCLNLNRVDYVARQAGPEGGVTIYLESGAQIDLAGPDGEAFLRAWDDHAAAKAIERGPPAVLGARLILPPVEREADRGEQEGLFVRNPARNHDQA